MPRNSPLLVLLLTVFLDLVGFSIIFPIYAEMLHHYGQEPGGLLATTNALLAATFGIDDPNRHAALFGGILSALYATVQFAVTPWWGRLSDRVGRRPVLTATVVLNLAGYLLWVMAGSFELLLASRIVAALGSGNIGVASAAVADLSRPEHRARTMGVLGAAIGLGFITGPAIGTLYHWMPKPASAGEGFGLHPFSAPAAVAAGLALINLLWLLARFPETLPAEHRGRARTERTASVRALFGRALSRPSRVLNLAYFTFMLGLAGFESTLVFLASHRLGWGHTEVGLLMVWLGLCSVTVQGVFVRRLAPEMGERRLALLGIRLMIPGFLLLAAVAWFPSAAGIIIAVTALSVAIGFVSPTLAALASLATGPADQGRVLGAYRSAGALGRAAGPLAAALLYFGLGPGAPYLFAAGLTFVPMWLVLRVPLPGHGAAS